MAVLFVSSVAAAFAVFTAPVDLKAGIVAGTASGKGMPSLVRLMTPFFNIYGTVLLAGGALKSSWYFLWSGGSLSRAAGTALVAAGAIVVATDGTLTRFNIPGALYITEFAGLLLIFAGFYFSNRPMKSARPEPEEIALRRKRVTRWSVVSGVVIIFGFVISLPILPWTMGIVKDVKHVYISQLPTENRGTYLLTSNGVMELFAWYVEPEDFPTDAPVLDATSIHSIAVVEKQFDAPENYELVSLNTNEVIPWKSFQQNGMQMIFDPGQLSAGDYELVTPTDSMFGGDTVEYFTLK
jgi:hypothetical protein